MSRARTSLVALALIAVVAIGCGGSEGEGTGDTTTATDTTTDTTTTEVELSDEEQIAAVIEGFFTQSDPSQCQTALTPAAIAEFLPGLPDRKGPQAACYDAIAKAKAAGNGSANAGSAEVSDIVIDGASGTATVTPDGGRYAGTAVTLTLVDQDGWKIDGIEDVEIVDEDAYQAQPVEP